MGGHKPQPCPRLAAGLWEHAAVSWRDPAPLHPSWHHHWNKLSNWIIYCYISVISLHSTWVIFPVEWLPGFNHGDAKYPIPDEVPGNSLRGDIWSRLALSPAEIMLSGYNPDVDVILLHLVSQLTTGRRGEVWRRDTGKIKQLLQREGQGSLSLKRHGWRGRMMRLMKLKEDRLFTASSNAK